MDSRVAYLALGANLGQPVQNIRQAVQKLQESRVRIHRIAPLYLSKPVGPAGQPDYVNTVAEVETDLSPEELLDLAKKIEGELGRVTTVRWGARVIDIDIALYGTLEMTTQRLTIPHAQLRHRRFVLQPLADLVPELEVPGQRMNVRALLEALSDDPRDLSRLQDPPRWGEIERPKAPS